MADVNLDSWVEFNDSEFLEAKRVKGPEHEFVIVEVNAEVQDGRPRIVLLLESDEGTLKRKFGLNKTNGKFLESQGITTPKELIDKVITFEKVRVNNPSTKQMVDSLQIASIK